MFNRIVINQLSGHEHGLYCEECEKEKFGTLLEDSYWHQSNGCAFCDAPGKFKLPKLDCLIENEDGSAHSHEYLSLDDSVVLCVSHTEALFAEQVDLSTPELSDQNSIPKVEV